MTNRYVVYNRIIHISQFPLLMVLIFNDQSPIDKISDLKSLKQRKNAHLVQSVPQVTAIEAEQFYKKLSNENRCVILSLIPQFAKEYEPVESKYQLPKPLRGIFDPTFTTKTKKDIKAECERLFESLMGISYDDILAIEIVTRGQSSQFTWFEQRDGRITGSRVRKVIKTNLLKPSLSLFQEICSSEMNSFFGNEHTR